MLTTAQIDKLTSRPKVRRIAVENFLGSLGGLTAYQATQNLYMDAASYRWNAETVKAIRDGIELSKRKA